MNLCNGELEDTEIIKYINHGHKYNYLNDYENNIVGYIEYNNKQINIHVDRNNDYLNYY